MSLESYDFFGIARDGRPPRPKASRPRARAETLQNAIARFLDRHPEVQNGSPFWADEVAKFSTYYREAALRLARERGYTCFEVRAVPRAWVFARDARGAVDQLARFLHAVV